MPASTRLTVLLADDHNLVRRGFRRMLEDDAGIVVIGEASDGEQAIRLTQSLKPQVVVMDCAMPVISGLVAARRIHDTSPDVAILMLSMHSEETLIRRALDAGALGYILKNALDLDLSAAVRRVAAGEIVLDAGLSTNAQLKGEKADALTPREIEIVRLICDGLSNREIAGRLKLSVNTVSVHRTNIMSRLGIHKAAELVIYAIQNGLVHLP